MTSGQGKVFHLVESWLWKHVLWPVSNAQQRNETDTIFFQAGGIKLATLMANTEHRKPGAQYEK
jgi:hypothetical protein